MPERVNAVDLPLGSLTPVRRRQASPLVMQRLEANIAAVGLIEPLLIYQQGNMNFILDGYLRYQVLTTLGVTTVPCIVLDSLDCYTPNRCVNFLSRAQRWGMLKRALEVVDEDTLKSALGMERLRNGPSAAQRSMLCHQVLSRIYADQLSARAATPLAFVTAERQVEILALIDQAKDQSPAFVRAQVLRTRVEDRVQRPGQRSPWDKVVETRKKLVERLTEAEERHDFYQGLYRQYAADLVKLAVHVRQILRQRDLRTHLAEHHAEALHLFKQIVEQYGETASGD